jgi:hypothetical protein
VAEEEIALSERYTYGYLRRFALGVLRMRPGDFGLMLVGDFLDAMGGYYEQKYEDHKLQANLTRTATAFLINIHLKEIDRMTPKELWKMPWDEEVETVVVSKEEYEEQIKKSEEFFKKALNGTGNNKS